MNYFSIKVIPCSKAVEIFKENIKNDSANSIDIAFIEMVYGYMEGHDYCLCCGNDNKLYLLDMEDESYTEVTPLRILQMVSDWNYELLEEGMNDFEESTYDLSNAKEAEAFYNCQMKIARLNIDRIYLDRINFI